jgi:Zn ribbon nucleic-acid-binding protein
MAKKITCELCGEGKCDCHKDLRVSFCPRCKSTDVRYVFGLGNVFGVIPKMKCFKCGYTAPSFPILKTTKAKLRKKNKKVKKKKVARAKR